MQILKDSGKGFTTILTPTAQTTTNSYVDLSGSKIDTGDKGIGSLAIVLKNTHAANDINWKILGSIDDTTYVEIVAEETVQEVSTGTAYSVATAPYRYYKVQVKTTSAGNHGTAVVHVIAK